MTYKILVINPGSTSTKVALFENPLELDTLVHRLVQYLLRP